MAFMYATVLTGGIATGKSTSVEILSSLGFSFIDADKVAHQVLEEERKTIAKLFGKRVIKGSKVDRKALGSIIFSDREKKEQLESLLHPLIYERIASLSEELDQLKKTYIIDIPLFFESKRYPITRSILVYAPKEIQLERLMKRDNYSREEAMKRIASQMDIEKKKELATYIIDNSSNLQALQDECVRISNLIQ